MRVSDHFEQGRSEGMSRKRPVRVAGPLPADFAYIPEAMVTFLCARKLQKKRERSGHTGVIKAAGVYGGDTDIAF